MKELPLEPVAGDREVRSVLAAALASMEENFVALVDRPVSLRLKRAGLLPRAALLAAVDEPLPCLVGTVAKDYDGTITLMVNLPDAVTFSCLLRMVAEEVVKERRAGGAYDQEDRESFAEVGNILYSAIDEVLRGRLPRAVSCRLVEAPRLEPGGEGGGVIPEGGLYLLELALKIGDFPAGASFLVLPRGLAEAMNRGDLASGTPLAEEAGSGAEAEEGPVQIEGVLAAFPCREATARLVREAAAKAKMQLELHAPGEIPNPATLKDRFVLIEIPGEDEEKHFQWCQRLRRASAELPLVVALGWPTRQNVLRAFMAGVDGIVGLPCTAAALVSRLGRVARTRQPSPAEQP